MSDSNLDYESFIPQLLDEVPQFEPIYAEHLKDQFGELLPYLLMGDFTRFVYDACRRSTTEKVHSSEWSQILQTSLSLMERAIHSPDERLETLIWLGFVENLTPSREEDVEVYKAIKAMLGPKLREVLVTHFDQDNWYENKSWGRAE